MEASLALVDGGGPELRAALRRCTLYTRPRAEAHVYLLRTPDELSLARYLELDWVQVMSPGTVPRPVL